MEPSQEILTASERRLFIRRQDWSKALAPVCAAMKQMGFETATIADVMRVIQEREQLTTKFYIVDNRYLVPALDSCYDLHLAQELPRLPYWPFRLFYLAFRIHRDENQAATEPLDVGEDGPRP